MKEEKKMQETQTESDKMWEELRKLNLDIFGLPGQTLEGHASRVIGAPNELLLKLKSSAVLPALEQVLTVDHNGRPLHNPKFKIEQLEYYISIKRA